MMKQPSVTACLTVCNAESHIEKVLESLANQSWANLKIVLSDDASDDMTSGIIGEFAQKTSSEIHIYRQEHRLGWVENTNFVLNEVDTEYFFLCYHDDILHSRYVESLVNCLMTDTNLIGAYSDVVLQKVNGEKLVRTYDEVCDVEDPVERGLSIIRMQGLPWVCNRGVFRSNVLNRVGGLQKNLAGEFSAAFPWVLGLALEGKFARVPEILCHKILYASGVSTRWKKTYREFLAMYLGMIPFIWKSSLTDDQKDQLMLEVNSQCEALLVNKRRG